MRKNTRNETKRKNLRKKINETKRNEKFLTKNKRNETKRKIFQSSQNETKRNEKILRTNKRNETKRTGKPINVRFLL